MALATTTPTAPVPLAQLAGSTMNLPPAGPNPNAVLGGVVDRRPWRYWDTLIWNLASPPVALPTTISFFQVAIGQLDPRTLTPKTKLQTNMNAGGMFNAPECLLMQQLSLYLCIGNVYGDILKVWENCYLEFKISGKIFWEGLPVMFPSGLGLMGELAKGSTTDQFFTNGFPAPQAAWRAGSFSKYIAPLQPFTCTLVFPGVPQGAAPPILASNFKLVAFLDGLADTSVG
jgi:hypothetical protein